MAAGNGSGAEARKWYFTREQIENSPSRRAGQDPDKELSYRQQAANLLQDMGQRLNVSQLTINTAIVYMHRFYMIQSFTRFHRNAVAPAVLFLAAKVEEQPRKLEHVIKVTHACLNPQEPSPDIRSEAYLQQAQDLVILENIILQTLGFEITIDHPHTHVVKCTQLVRASKDLAQTSYFMATNSLHLTTFSLQYSPPIVACVCIHLACKWSNWEIPVSTDGKHWWEYVDPTVTLELLDELTHEFLQILEKTPNRLKRIKNWRAGQAAKRPKGQEQDGDDSFGELTMMSMISRAASGSTIAGLMSMSASSSSSSVIGSGPSVDQLSSLDHDAKADMSDSQQHWPADSHLDSTSVHRTSDTSVSAMQNHGAPAGADVSYHSLHQDGGAAYTAQKPGTSKYQPPAPVQPARVTLNEYRAKRAEELAAQKRMLENLEANVKEQYASAAHALIKQQKERLAQSAVSPQSAVQKERDSSPIILKIPIANAEKPDKLPSEKIDKTVLKLKIPVTPEKSAKQEEIRVRIKVPASEKYTSSDEGSSKGKEHREKHREHLSNHHHHHHHHHSHKHSHLHGGGSGSKRSGDLKHSVRQSTSSHSNHSSGSSSRKRPHSEDPSIHNHQQKVSKTSKIVSVASSHPSSAAAGLQHAFPSGITDLPFPGGLPQPTFGQMGIHTKTDKGSADANGHGTNQTNDYQDTFEMLNSLLSAQGVQPAQPSGFDYIPSYGEYRYPGRSRASNPSNASQPRPPPLPVEPPPPLPPLPK
ncbi:cyclin-T1 isoform X2 [Latimeria chalumnae]|uniref:cyclin-T1 isoform X2 n=1 Tax=Latimeria chalumnae TaxID=7897 RepID=UPI0003C14D78|nr:PREDICTED: cyclin-T1 isoform X2 [Latimeria chalumnae]|eukprot:XP_005991487.1 PREDICTED: cyclin-T1 isoform X2 [Latimeria chalumnae]